MLALRSASCVRQRSKQRHDTVTSEKEEQEQKKDRRGQRLIEEEAAMTGSVCRHTYITQGALLCNTVTLPFRNLARSEGSVSNDGWMRHSYDVHKTYNIREPVLIV